MNIPHITIAVDGYSSTGKSSFAKLVAKQFGILYLDSGALYRGVTLFARENGFISSDNVVDSRLEAALAGLELGFDAQGRCCIAGRCIETEIRSMAVSGQVSPIAAVPYVRNFVDARLHALAEGRSVVMDGRDIGTTVFPNAEIKVFMTARPEVRARRRYDELCAKGQKADYDEVLENLRQRDYIDSHRSASPLRQADDAFVLDNSGLTMAEELAWIRGLIQGKFGLFVC